MRRLLLLACLAPAVVACGGEAATKASSCSPESSRVPCTSARIGVEYALALSTHCGVGHTYFDGRYWVIDPTQPSSGNSLHGAMTLVTRDLAQFRGGGLRFAFKPARPALAPPSSLLLLTCRRMAAAQRPGVRSLGLVLWRVVH